MATSSFPAENPLLEMLWSAAPTIFGLDPAIFRQDRYGALIARNQYGKKTPIGWEIDHLMPRAHGGTDSVGNLEAIQWHDNRVKSDQMPKSALLTALGG